MTNDINETAFFEGSTADQRTVDVRHLHEFAGIGGLDAAAILDADSPRRCIVKRIYVAGVASAPAIGVAAAIGVSSAIGVAAAIDARIAVQNLRPVAAVRNTDTIGVSRHRSEVCDRKHDAARGACFAKEAHDAVIYDARQTWPTGETHRGAAKITARSSKERNTALKHQRTRQKQGLFPGDNHPLISGGSVSPPGRTPLP